MNIIPLLFTIIHKRKKDKLKKLLNHLKALSTFKNNQELIDTQNKMIEQLQKKNINDENEIKRLIQAKSVIQSKRSGLISGNIKVSEQAYSGDHIFQTKSPFYKPIEKDHNDEEQ